MSEPSEPVLLDVSERIATVTLNRPEARNALTGDLLQRLPEIFAAADAADDVDVIIHTGTDRAFCAGHDLAELAAEGSRLIEGPLELQGRRRLGRGMPAGSAFNTYTPYLSTATVLPGVFQYWFGGTA